METNIANGSARNAVRSVIMLPQIERNPKISGGKPVIAGTRIKVSQIALEYERLSWTPDEIIAAHPHLTLAQVHTALAYYYEHIAEINADLRREEQLSEELSQRHPSKLRSKYAS
jgi:uncharacterized protein (DUF433 family)